MRTSELVPILVTVGELVALWFLISVPVYLAAKRTSPSVPGLLGQSIGATVIGAAVYEMTILGATVLYGSILGEGETASTIALAAAAFSWGILYRRSLGARWRMAIAMVIVVALLFLGVNLLGSLLGLSLPTLFQFTV